MAISKCNKCGEEVNDLDAGFSPGIQKMEHSCGGVWVVKSVTKMDAMEAHRANLTRFYPQKAKRLDKDGYSVGDYLLDKEGIESASSLFFSTEGEAQGWIDKWKERYLFTLSEREKLACMEFLQGQAEADLAFAEALKSGRLTKNESAWEKNCVDDVMYMGKDKSGKALFKNRHTRDYIK